MISFNFDCFFNVILYCDAVVLNLILQVVGDFVDRVPDVYVFFFK